MKCFGRVVRQALSHRITFVLSVFCALGVAVLWGGNITAVYPLVEVVLDGKSATQWIEGEIADSEQTLDALTRQETINETSLGTARDGSAGQEARHALSQTQIRIKAEQTALDRYRWVQPYLAAYAPSDAFRTLLVVCLLLMVGTLFKSGFRIAGQILVSRLAHQTEFELRKEFFRRTLRLDLASFNEKGRGDLIARFTSDLHYLTSGIQTLIGPAIREPLKAVACLAGAAYISWRLLLLTLIVAPIAGFLINRLAQSLKRANRRALIELAGIYETLGETFGSMTIIKAFTMESQQRRGFHQSAKEFYRKSMKIARYNSLVSPLTEIMGMGMIVLAILAGGYLAIEQQTHLFGFLKISNRPLDRGSLMLFYAMLAGVSDPARRLSNLFGSLQQASAAGDRVFEMLDREPAISDPPRPVPLPHLSRELRFENVSFAYNADQPVLRDIDLVVSAGETIAVVGPNGCGKSTLAGLILRLYDPCEGHVSINGVDLCNVRLRDLRQRIGVVTQEAMLLNDTVAENIRYGKPTATNAEVIAAAKQTHAHSFIQEKLANGYNTLVGPGGCLLSGGQRQRIALARAILRDPEILILDEATSQIDVESEHLIHDVLSTFTKGRTTILITHRTSSLDLADRIIVMDQGTIEDIGPRDALLARCDLFRRLCNTGLREIA